MAWSMASVLWCAAVAACGVGAETEDAKATSRRPAVHLGVDNTVGDLLAHPASVRLLGGGAHECFVIGSWARSV